MSESAARKPATHEDVLAAPPNMWLLRCWTERCTCILVRLLPARQHRAHILVPDLAGFGIDVEPEIAFG